MESDVAYGPKNTIYRRLPARGDAWIDTQRKQFPLPVMCETLAVSASGYRAWKHTLPVAANLLDRNFAPQAPNQAWSADIT